MTEDSKQQANLAVNVLRKLLYQEHGWAEPSDPLVYDDEVMQIQIQRKKDLIERAHKEHIQYVKKHNLEIPEKETEDILQNQCEVNVQKLLDLISNIGLLVVTLSQPNATERDIDECLSTNEKLYNLPEVLDYILSITISGTFKATQERKDLKRFCDIFIIGMIVVVQYLFDEEFRRNENKENTDSDDTDEEKMINVLRIDEDDIGINTSRLQVGQTVKNYKELCALLGEKESAGNSRKAQLKEFARYFEWEKSGQKFLITDIYDTPLPKEDGRNKGKYVKCIEIILLNYLSKQKGYTYTLNKKKWWELLGMVNLKYDNVSQEELLEINPVITKFEIRHYYQRCNKKLEEILFSALRSLSSRKLIDWEIETVIVTRNQEKTHYRVANVFEKKIILRAERYVLHKIMHLEKMFNVFAKQMQDEFYRLVNEILKDSLDEDWQYYFKQVKIIYNHDQVVEAIPDIEAELRKLELNDKVVNTLNEHAEEKYRKERKKYEDDTAKLFEKIVNGEDISEEKIFKIPDTYVMAQELLTDELIRLGHKNVSEEPYTLTKNEEQELDTLFLLDK